MTKASVSTGTNRSPASTGGTSIVASIRLRRLYFMGMSLFLNPQPLPRSPQGVKILVRQIRFVVHLRLDPLFRVGEFSAFQGERPPVVAAGGWSGIDVVGIAHLTIIDGFSIQAVSMPPILPSR